MELRLLKKRNEKETMDTMKLFLVSQHSSHSFINVSIMVFYSLSRLQSVPPGMVFCSSSLSFFSR